MTGCNLFTSVSLSYLDCSYLKFAWVSLERSRRPHNRKGPMSHLSLLCLSLSFLTLLELQVYISAAFLVNNCLSDLTKLVMAHGIKILFLIMVWSIPYFIPLAYSLFPLKTEESLTFCLLWHFLAWCTVSPIILTRHDSRIPIKCF